MHRLGLAAILLAAGGTAACAAPGEPHPGSATSTSVAPSVGHGSLAYCLGQHGIPAPPGPTTGPPPGVDPARWNEAMAACASLAPGPAG